MKGYLHCAELTCRKTRTLWICKACKPKGEIIDFASVTSFHLFSFSWNLRTSLLNEPISTVHSEVSSYSSKAYEETGANQIGPTKISNWNKYVSIHLICDLFYELVVRESQVFRSKSPYSHFRICKALHWVQETFITGYAQKTCFQIWW